MDPVAGGVVPSRPEAEGIADWAAAREAAGEGARPDGEGPASDPRSVADGAVVTLREVTSRTVREICRLQVAPEQRGLVAPNAVSFAEALFEPRAWYRAIYADGAAVGFVMLSEDPGAPEGPAYWVWRLMIDRRFQGRGYGRRVVELVVDHVRTLPGATELLLSWVPGPGGPEGFYLGLGFELTGETLESEVVGRLRLA